MRTPPIMNKTWDLQTSWLISHLFAIDDNLVSGNPQPCITVMSHDRLGVLNHVNCIATKKILKFLINGPLWENPLFIRSVDSHHNGPAMREAFPHHGVIMTTNDKQNLGAAGLPTLHTHIFVRRAGLLWSQQDFEWLWSVPLSSASLY